MQCSGFDQLLSKLLKTGNAPGYAHLTSSRRDNNFRFLFLLQVDQNLTMIFFRVAANSPATKQRRNLVEIRRQSSVFLTHPGTFPGMLSGRKDQRTKR